MKKEERSSHPDRGAEEGLIRPLKRRTDPDIGESALLVITPGDLEGLLKATLSSKVSCFDMGFFKLHVVEKKGGGSFSLAGPFLGAPHAVMGMEKIIALGARKIWAIGWCGSIQPDLHIGDFVIPTDAVCEEGTSSHYPIGDRPCCPDEELCKEVDELLLESKMTCRRGAVWTTDAPYRETPSKVLKYRDRGVLAVEMEMSALMTLAIYRDVPFASLLVVSDELFDLKWKPGFRSPVFKESRRRAGELMLQTAQGNSGELRGEYVRCIRP